MIGPFVFLDIDGVLNRHRPHANGWCGMDPKAVKLFNRLLDATGAKVVVASAWRYFVLRGEMTLAGLQGLLCTHGLNWGCIIDVLPADIPDGCGGADRGAAVEQWFRERYCISHKAPYVIIDDLDLGYSRRKMPWVETLPDVGFTKERFAESLAILKGQST